MTVAKGQIQPDKSYAYTCGTCQGEGKMKDGETCPYCYDQNLDKCLEEFQTARGERYYALLKTILSICGKEIYDEAVRIDKRHGKFTPVDLGYLCLRFDFGKRMKPLAEWLEECSFMPYGSYRRLQERGPKVFEMIEQAKIDYDMQDGNPRHH